MPSRTAIATGTYTATAAASGPGRLGATITAITPGALRAVAASIREDGPSVERVHVDTERGSLVAVSDGERTAVATTVAEPTVGLVAHDLRTALSRVRGDGS